MSYNVFPIAFAASSLSLIALIIRPHGDLIALSERYKRIINVIEKIKVKQSLTNMPELEIITSLVVGPQNLRVSMKLIKNS